jgi:CheY-like chemotaxis protein
MDEKLAHIVIIDDDEALVEALRDRLSAKGYTVSTATNGKDGLALALQKHPDLIILDIVMPQMNGWEVLDGLEADEWGKTAHVVMLSNSDDMENVSQAMEHNMREYIIKGSWPLDQLVLKIEEKTEKK